MNAYLDQYRNTQVQTASPEQILLLLYDGAIRFCQQAAQAMETGDVATKGERIGRAVAILSELSNTLDHEIGGEIAADLDGLYAFMLRELVRANRENDPEALHVVVTLLADLRETWSQAIEINRQALSGTAESGDSGVTRPLSAAPWRSP